MGFKVGGVKVDPVGDVKEYVGGNPVPKGPLKDTIFDPGHYGPLKNTPVDPSTWGTVLKNTPFDPKTWGLGEKKPGSLDPLSSIKLPQLERMRNLSELKDKGVVAAPQVGQNAWLQMAMKKQTADQARGLDAGVQNQAQALAAGRAMNPRALMSGASENLSGQGLLDTVKMRQSQALQNAMGNAGVQMQGAGKETDLNQFNAGLKNQASQVNISNSIQDVMNQNRNAAEKYGEVMKLKAADATSRGLAASGGGGKK